MERVSREQRKRQRQQSAHLSRTQSVLAEYLEHIRQQCDPATEQDQADDIERVAFFRAIVGQMQVDEDQTGQPDGNVEKENEAPVKVADDEAPGDGSEHRSYQRRDGHKAHRTQQICLGE